MPEELRWACAAGHSFDVARGGYVNLLPSRPGRHRVPGDSAEMVWARRRFLATGAFDPLTAGVARVLRDPGTEVVIDVGCGEGRHTRALDERLVLGVDVAKPAVASASRAHPAGWYAVASAAALPLGDGAVDAALVVFGPVFAGELARVVRSGGRVVAAHPGPRHLAELRALVYGELRPHELKPPLRHHPELFEEISSEPLRWEVAVDGPAALADLFTMTPYRWHGPPDIEHRLDEAARAGLVATAEVRITSYRRH